MIDKNDPRLTNFVLGELNPAEIAEIQDAISNSEELQGAVEEIRQTAMLLDAAYQTEEPLCLLDEQKAEIKQVQIDEAARELKPVTGGRPWLPIVLAASLLGLLVGGAIYLQNLPLNPAVAKRLEEIGDLKESDVVELKRKAVKSRMQKQPVAGAISESDDAISIQAPTDSDKEVAMASGNEMEKSVAVEKLKYDFAQLVDEQRFGEAQAVARQVADLAPESPTAEDLNRKAILLRRLGRIESTAKSKEEGFWSAMTNVDEASAPTGVANPSSELYLKFGRDSFDGPVEGIDLRGGVDHLDSLELSETKNLEERVPGAGSAIVGRDPGGRPDEGNDVAGDFAVDGLSAKPEAAQRMKTMQQLAGGGFGGSQGGGKFDEAGESDSGIGGQADGDQGGPGSEGRFGFSGDDGRIRGRGGRGMPVGGGRQANSVQPGVDGQNSESLQRSQSPLRSMFGEKIEVMDKAESEGQPAPEDAPMGISDAKAREPNESGSGGQPSATGKQLSAGQNAGEADAERSGEELRQMARSSGERGARRESAKRYAGTENAPVDQRAADKAGEIEEDEFSLPGEAKAFTAPLIAKGDSAREEDSKDTSKKRILVEFERLGDIESTNQFVDELVKRVDPSGTREIDIKELFKKSRELQKSEAGRSGERDKDLLLWVELGEQLVELDGKRFDFGATPTFQKVDEVLKQRNAKIRQTRTWKRVKAIPNTTRLMIGDKTELDLTGMQVNVQVDGFRARVLLDYFYYNDRDQALDGNFKLRLPDDASLYYFAFGESAYDLSPKGEIATEEFLDNGTQFVSLGAEKIRAARQDAWKNVKESRMVPREKAAHAYNETVRRKIDPALVEWSGAGVFNAQVSPLAPKKLHRIVIGYDVNLTRANGNWIYELDLPKQTGQCQVDINVQPVAGVEYAIEPKSDPFENVVDGKTQRRYRFKGPQKKTIRLTANQPPEMLLYSADSFWGVQVTPELPVEKVAGNPRAIFMVDTSLSSNPDKFNVWLKLLESTLESNRDSLKQFNVVFFNVDAHFWQEQWIDNTQENTQRVLEKCNTLALEGATDLYGAIEKIANSDWVFGSGNLSGGKLLASPDLFLFSDGAVTWGETNLRLISRQLQDHQLGSLFAYQTGMTGTAISGLRFLAGQSGGAVFSVTNESEIKVAATAHRKRPWKLMTITAAGASDVMTAGRVQWVYPGQAITVVGRGVVQDGLKFEFEQSGQAKMVTVEPERIKSELASRLYGQVAVGQLESLGAKVFDVAASYARYFRVTGETCSLLMLESEAEYQRFNIKPQEDLFVIKTKDANDLVDDVLQKSASELADPKAQLVAWLARLESMPGMSLTMPHALKMVMDEMQIVAISKPLDCGLTAREGLPDAYVAGIESERLDYEIISTEANRRGKTSVDDAIKVYSSLVERNPGDLVIARDVAFTALEMGRPAQAYHLLRSVAKARPFEGSIYPALGQCLTQLGQADMAIVYYEIALNGSFNRMGDDFHKIVSAEYMYLLRQVVDGRQKSSVKQFAVARLETLKKNLQFQSADLLITMMWNTDQTDVDLHIFEPSGEECSYENKKTRSGGRITSDITTGYGPEMYSNPEAPSGKYDVKVKYFASNQNRTEMRNKVHLTIYRGFGTPAERVTRRTIRLKQVGEKESVATIGVD